MKYVILALIVLSSQMSFAQHNLKEERLLQIERSPGIQDRVVVMKEGKVKRYLGTRMSYIAEINAAKVKRLKTWVESSQNVPLTKIKGDVNDPKCANVASDIYRLYKASGENYVIAISNACGFSANEDQRFLTILEGLQALGDLD